jgi:hypothetical protein
LWPGKPLQVEATGRHSVVVPHFGALNRVEGGLLRHAKPVFPRTCQQKASKVREWCGARNDLLSPSSDPYLELARGEVGPKARDLFVCSSPIDSLDGKPDLPAVGTPTRKSATFVQALIDREPES